MPCHDPKKNPRATLGFSTTLFPVSERGRADPHERGELALAQTVALAHRADIGLLKSNDARRLRLPSQNRATLPHTLEQLSEKILFHGYSVSTILRRTRSTSGDARGLTMMRTRAQLARVPRLFQSRDYRLFWTGSLISNLGFWMQQLALGWLVYALTRSVSLLGAVSFCSNLPILLLGLVAGAIADRMSRRTIMLTSLAVMSVTAGMLALLTASGHIQVWHIVVLAMVAGTAGALYTPAMQAVIPSLVEPPQLLNAISLNSVQFNLARTLGPALAGFACDTIGPEGCFALNAAGFLVMTLMLSRVRIPPSATLAVLPMGRALGEGLRYARTHPVILPALLLTTVLSVFGFPYIILLPALARDTLGLGPKGLGYLMAALGAGAVTGGLLLSALGEASRKDILAIASAIAFGVTLTAFALVPGPRGTALILFVLGALQTACIASINTTIQMAVHDGMRGRVMSMMTVILFGFATSGALLIGYLGDRIGVPAALASGGVVIALAATGAALGAPLPLAQAAPRSRTAA